MKMIALPALIVAAVTYNPSTLIVFLPIRVFVLIAFDITACKSK
jgi:hypothetical protein